MPLNNRHAPAVTYLLWRLATRLARIVPQRSSYYLASLIADVFFATWREKREATIDNMRHVLRTRDDVTATRVARQSFRNYGQYLIDFIRAPKIHPDDLDAKLEFDNWQAVDAAHAEGKGVIFVLMHFGNWDIGGHILSRRGYAINVVAETMAHDKLNEMVVNARTLGGMHVIPMERSALPMLRALRRNEALAILMDRPLAVNGIAVRFFGSQTILPAGPARLALRTGARVMVAAAVRIERGGDRILGLLEPNIQIERSGNLEQDIRSLTEAILAAHERFIRRFPDQWYMFRRMWPPLPQADVAALAPEQSGGG